MAAPTLKEVVRLAEQLSPEDRRRLCAALTAAEDAQRADQRQRNQNGIELLDAWAEEATDTDDSWWPAFARALDADRTSHRPLIPEEEREPDPHR